MRMAKILFSVVLVIVLQSWVLHPLKMSATVINQTKNKLSISTKLFADDFEKQMQRMHPKMNFKKLNSKEKSQIVAYYKSHFLLSQKDSIANVEIDGISLEDAGLILRIKAHCTIKPEEPLNLENTLMFEAYSIQKNVVNYKSQKGIEKLVFNKEDSIQMLN